LESQKRHPSGKVIKALAEALDLDECELFFVANPDTERLISQPAEPDEVSSAWEIFQKDENLRAIPAAPPPPCTRPKTTVGFAACPFP
jgi:hypothetical protein